MDPPTKALAPVVSSAYSEPKSADTRESAYVDALRGIANLRQPIQRQTTGVLVRLKLKQFFQSAFVSAKGFKNETTAYRPDIDGLRCVAVMSVVLYHFDFVNFSGGFIGVDVFFVISGYLITANVSAEVREGQFSLLHFYARRIRRIFPVLFVVVLATLAASYFIFLPSELEGTGRNALWSTFFLANIFFYFNTNYFLGSSFPLLHTWSLAVEEQFYIGLPLLIMATQRLIWSKTKIIFLLFAAVSLLVSQYYLSYDSGAAFYLIESRAWELLIGSLLAFGFLPKFKSAFLLESTSVAGIVLILACAHFYSRSLPFPGLLALLPCLGSALIILAGQQRDTFGGRMLSLKPVVFTGLISYSLYMWHWPLRIFYGEQFSNIFSKGEKIALVFAAYSLAVLSWAIVERPARRSLGTLPTPKVLLAGAGMMATAAFCGLVLVVSNGFPGRLTAEQKTIAKYLEFNPAKMFRAGTCFVTSETAKSRGFDDEQCLKLSDQKRNYLVLGDSHAAHLWLCLETDLPDVNFLQATSSGCAPTLDSGGERQCLKVRKFVFEDFLPSHRVDKIIMSAFWNYKDLAAIPRTVKFLKQYANEIIIVGPALRYNISLPRILAGRHGGFNASTTIERALLNDESLNLDKGMHQLADQIGVSYLSAIDALCSNGPCLAMADSDVPMQFDTSHLTDRGSIFLVKRWLSFYPI
jgi:peptidoglycan/LPS O-acetylase OafA/YrhL